MTEIPLFPLNIVVLPYEEVPLHIFESRYKQMVDNSIKNGTPFGIVLNNNGTFDNIGCSLDITKVINHYKTGEYDLIATGRKCFHVIEKTKKDNLWIGNVEYMAAAEDENEKILKQVQDRYLELLMKLGKEENFEIYLDRKLSFQFLIGIALPLELKKTILRLKNERERLLYIYDLFDKILSQPLNNPENKFPMA